MNQTTSFSIVINYFYLLFINNLIEKVLYNVSYKSYKRQNYLETELLTTHLIDIFK